MTKYYLIFGSIAGTISAFLEYMLFSGKLGYDRMGGVLFGKILALIGCIVFGVILIKKLNGRISFMRTSFSGLMIAIVCTIFSTIGYSIMAYPDGKFFDEAKEYTYEYWLEENKDKPEELAKEAEAREQIESKFSVQYHTVLELLMFSIFGIVFTAFFAGVIADRKTLAG